MVVRSVVDVSFVVVSEERAVVVGRDVVVCVVVLCSDVVDCSVVDVSCVVVSEERAVVVGRDVVVCVVVLCSDVVDCSVVDVEAVVVGGSVVDVSCVVFVSIGEAVVVG